ncbi:MULTISPECIES: MBL fold metallo-hydrolase [Methylotenera]|uniref:MBL fold metallo-hydrolase n=1 Tax=Methylotenera TaxID=359407 RepID=UPI000360B35A|nr:MULTISPECIES: MBL fold metallo-hydrolase [Methylotenera]
MFKQIFDDASSTYTYLIVDDATQEAVIIDPVASHIDAYIQLINELNCHLKYALETHVHADHITASGMLREYFSLQTGASALCGVYTADMQLNDGDVLLIGQQEVKVIATPGHTAGAISYWWNDRIFTGDSLLINGCGRTDFQGGDAGTLYDSITNRLFTLPDETLVYPAHDYNGKQVSCVGQEKNTNPRFVNKSRDAFIQLMDALDLPKPDLIDVAVPANRMEGIWEGSIQQG